MGCCCIDPMLSLEWDLYLPTCTYTQPFCSTQWVCVCLSVWERVCAFRRLKVHTLSFSLSRYLSFCFLFLFFFCPFVFVPSMSLLFFIHSNPNFYKGALSDNIEIGCEHFTEKFKWLYPHVALTRSRKSFVKLFFFEQRNHNCFLFVSC